MNTEHIQALTIILIVIVALLYRMTFRKRGGYGAGVDATCLETSSDLSIMPLDEVLKLAEGGDLQARLEVAERYATGDDIDDSSSIQSTEKALYWVSKAVGDGGEQINDAKVQEKISDIYWDCGQYSQALTYLLKASEANLPSAQCTLGMIYLGEEGRSGIEPDNEKAFYWIRKSAENNYSFAYFHLGEMYYNGIGTEKDYHKASDWYVKALRFDADTPDRYKEVAKARLDEMLESLPDIM